MAIIDRAYYSQHFDLKFVVFGLVYFSLWKIEVCTNFWILFLLIISCYLVGWFETEPERVRARMSSGHRRGTRRWRGLGTALRGALGWDETRGRRDERYDLELSVQRPGAAGENSGNNGDGGAILNPDRVRSEERRVGKECRL